MHFRSYVLFLGILLLATTLKAQESRDPHVDEVLAFIELTATNSIPLEELIERLSAYRNRPLNLNKANEQDLSDLCILNPLQIRALLNHIRENGPLLEVWELQSIDHFDLTSIQLLVPFVSVGRINTLKNTDFDLFGGAKHDLLLRCQQVVQSGNTPDTGYLGSPQQLLLRYRYRYGNALSFSLQAEKDPGETFLKQQRMGFDFVSANLELKRVGVVEKLLIGDYNLQFGQGLALWSGLGFGKSALLSSIAKQEGGLKPYTSVYEGLFFRGLAAQLAFKSLKITPFYSYRKLDASRSDSLGIGSISTAGLHRTFNELANKNRLGQQVLGTALQWDTRSLGIGLSVYHTRFSSPLAPKNDWVNYFKFSGRSLSNSSVFAHYSQANTYYFGEIAHSFIGKPAALFGLLSSLSDKLSIGLLYRSYPISYHSFYNAALAESSTSYNEKGFYSGLTYKLARKWEWSMYADVFRFPWLAFNTHAPSQGSEVLQQLTFKPSKESQLQMVYQRSQKFKNVAAETAIPFIVPYVHQKIRLDFRYPISKTLRLHHRAELVRISKERGYLFLHDINYQPLQSKISGNIRLALFDVSDYDARVYAFQQDVLFAYAMDAYQNKGVQTYVNARYTLRKGLDIWLRYETKKYIKEASIGSSQNVLAGSRVSEGKLQIRYQF